MAASIMAGNINMAGEMAMAKSISAIYKWRRHRLLLA